jgi:hypothetical protein
MKKVLPFQLFNFLGITKNLSLSNSTLMRWWKEDFEQTVEIQGRITDYCNFCFSLKMKIQSLYQKKTLLQVYFHIIVSIILETSSNKSDPYSGV